MARVVGSDLIEEARQRGRIVFELLPGDIVTDVARETAARIGIRLLDGPLEKPAVVQADGATTLRRVKIMDADLAKYNFPDNCPKCAQYKVWNRHRARCLAHSEACWRRSEERWVYITHGLQLPRG